MAHFAELNADNIVQRVIVVANTVLDNNGVEDETLGINFCKSLFGQNTQWKQCSYNSTFRFRFPAPGMFYDAERNGFYTPQPHDNWVWNDITKRYQPPVDYPTDGKRYTWDQDNTQWVEFSE